MVLLARNRLTKLYAARPNAPISASRSCMPTVTHRASCACRWRRPIVMPLECAMDELGLCSGHRSGEAAANQRHVDRSGQRYAVHQPLPDGRASIAPAPPSAGTSASWRHAAWRDGDWLVGCRHRRHHVSQQHSRPAPHAFRSIRMARRGCRWQPTKSARASATPSLRWWWSDEARQIGPGQVTVWEVGDSSLPPAPVAGGSNSTASVSNAIAKACDEIWEKRAGAISPTAPSKPMPRISRKGRPRMPMR